ncbi:hypothetical protein BK809_0000476 [Diplodia seriata]|uniref:NACHT domain-containing protein n=1 Tax=Diplodia seriata TaxID=420778 RepID=A0A1S8BH62_9PEZI|nr:hypothetical protein BK809_0000476 [Diplodia seriata]
MNGNHVATFSDADSTSTGRFEHSRMQYPNVSLLMLLRSISRFEEDVRDRVASILDKDAAIFFREIQNDIKNGPITATSVSALKAAEERRASRHRSWKAFNRFVAPVINLLTGYYNVIDTICSADPTPGAVIWGCLKILINSASRAAHLFDSFGDQIDRVSFHLERINHFKTLFHESDSMNHVLHRSCLNVVAFCTLVWKECKRSTPVFWLKSFSPGPTREFEKIASAIKTDREDLEDLGGWIHQEKGDSHRQEFFKFLAQQHEEQKRKRQLSASGKIYQSAVQWLGGQSSASSQDRVGSSRPETTVVDTTDWIFEAAEFKEWTASSTNSPVFWMTATPGAGKSMLCSQVIQKTKAKFPSAGVASYFYRFDERVPTLQVLQSIAQQLLEQIWSTKKELPDSICAFVDTLPKVQKNGILDMIRAIAESTVFTNTYIFLDGVDEEPSEGPPHSQPAPQILSDLIPLTEPTSKGLVRLWVSSQERAHISKKLESHPRVNLTDQNEAPLRSFFDQELPQLRKLDLEHDELDQLMSTLRDRVKGNFLWARCMIEHIRDICESPEDVQNFIETSQPWSLDEYYAALFRRTQQHVRERASKILSIVCFARRRVSVSEIRDALCMMRSPESKVPRKKPRLHMVKSLFPPFIITEGPGDDESDKCELFHGTVRRFLESNPDILAKDYLGPEAVSINEYHLAEVCTRYLADPRFEKPLSFSEGQWKTFGGEAIETDGFLRYSAKYWDKHLDAVKPTPNLKALVSRFVLSSNYQTLLQLQHLYVDSHFSIFTVNGRPEHQKFLRRVFPDWFASRDSQECHIRRDYREFIHEWSYYLKCGCCENPKCLMPQFAGEIDRCLFGALGRENFMSQFQSRYVSFKLSNNEPTGITSTRQCYEGYSHGGDFVHVLQFVSRTATSHLRFVCETWQLKNMEYPCLCKRQFIDVGEESYWPLYLRLEDDDVKTRYSQEKPISFGDNGDCLRIGSSIFLRDKDGNFSALQPGNGGKDEIPAYFQEFALIPGLVVIASRRNSNMLGPESSITEDPFQDLANLFARAQQKRGEDSSSDTEVSESDPEDDETSLSSSEESWSSMDESCSEASTEPSDALEDENALEMFKGHIGSSESGSTTEEEDTEETDSEVSSGSDLGGNPFARFHKGYRDDDSDADEAYVALNRDSDSDEGSDRVRAFLAYESRKRPRKQTQPDLRASIQVFRTSESGLKHLFRLRQPLHLPLYDSPPAIHPSLPLVAWPLGPSTILFLDYEARQYFTRKLRPTTSMTRQVFIKCHFSPSGQHLHIATLEAQQRQPLSRRSAQRKAKTAAAAAAAVAAAPPLSLSLFVSTYRLSATKPTRTPPAQIHRAKLALQPAVRSLPVARLPFAVTWTADYLYVAQSARALRVHRVRLFAAPPVHPSTSSSSSSSSSSSTSPDDQVRAQLDADLVLAEPCETVFLPATAATRSVRFFPGSSGGGGEGKTTTAAAAAARVLIGSDRTLMSAKKRLGAGGRGGGRDGELYDNTEHGGAGAGQTDAASEEAKFEGVAQGLGGRAAMPVGVWLREKDDLGGWGRSACGVRLAENRGLGRLDDKVERFDVDGDCDLEPYIV